MPPPHDQVVSLKREAADNLVDSPSSQDFALELEGGFDTRSDDGMISLDPDVLASLVIQLRTNLASAQSEREELITALAISQTQISDLAYEKERADKLEAELNECYRKNQDSEEIISTLRSKVEESRQGLMRLQAESRRMSQLSIHASSPHAMSPSLDVARSPGIQANRASKRQSLQMPPPSAMPAGLPNGRSHRPESFMSEPGTSNDTEADPSTVSSEAATAQNQASVRQSRRQSNLYIRPGESLLNPMGAEMEALRQELVSVRLELSQTKQELLETKEAREASDVCVKALKECKWSLIVSFLLARILQRRIHRRCIGRLLSRTSRVQLLINFRFIMLSMC